MAALPPPEFAYTPLAPGHVRLLEITAEHGKLPVSLNQQHLFDDQDVLVSHMHIADLKVPPLYDALSYTWGNPFSEFETKEDCEVAEKHYSPKLRLPVLCDGRLLYVGFSLYEALAGLRRTLRNHDDLEIAREDLSSPRRGPRPLVRNRIWIDAVCINQSDDVERAAQVKIMHTIYKEADAVLIWLGPQDEMAKQAVRAMLNLSMAPDLTAQTIHLSEQDRSLVFRKAGLFSIPDSWWHSMVSLLHRRWFQRAWIIQEVAWARIAILVCDQRLWVDLNVLLSVSDWMIQNMSSRDRWLKPWVNRSSTYFRPPGQSERTFGDWIISTIRSMGAIHHGARTDRPHLIAKTGVKKRSLLELLVRFWESQCSDLHDNVYALLSLCSDQSLVDSIPIDYLKPVGEVYIETARGILRSMRQLDLLLYSSRNVLSGQLQLPSWVPDWSKKPDPMPIGYDQGPEGELVDYDMVFPFCADGNNGDFAAPIWAGRSLNPSSGRRLVVQGIRVTSIKTVTPLRVEELGGVVRVLHEIPFRYSYFKSVPPQPFADSPASKDGPGAASCRAWARSDETRSEVLWRTVVADIWRGCHPAPDEAGLAFVRFLIHELKRAAGNTVNGSRLEAGRKLDGLLTLLRFLSGDEQRCLEEYQKRSGDDPQREDMLVTQPRRYLSQIEPVCDIFDLISTLRHRDDKDLSHYRRYVNGSRSIFSTEHHKLGLGPLSARCGDEVWILNGAKCPFVLRQRGGGTFEVVGPAYVHGIMHGQEVGYARGYVDAMVKFLLSLNIFLYQLRIWAGFVATQQGRSIVLVISTGAP
ncbi:hypothetical protein DL770_002676 [Monosporascus sp. CRB-9-2]|nr:hypothetical protein DL770_002676 [Monosporascus sp. CRB-9-2]